MKISNELYEEFKSAIEALTIYPNLQYQYDMYKQNGLSDMRFNWDVFSLSPAFFELTKKAYDAGLNDSNINTALAKILGNSGTNSKGKK